MGVWFFFSYLLVSCLSRPSWAPSWWCERWCSWEWAEFSVLTAEWVGSAVVPGSSLWEAKPGTNSASSSSTSSSFSAPSHSDAGPKWVCSSKMRVPVKRFNTTTSYDWLFWLNVQMDNSKLQDLNICICPLDGAKSLAAAVWPTYLVWGWWWQPAQLCGWCYP